MSESLPKCQWCNEAPVTHPMTDDGVYFHPENGCPSGLGHPVVRLPVRADQWRTLHDQSRCADLEAKLKLAEEDYNVTVKALVSASEKKLRAEAENATQRDRLAKIDALLATDSLESFNLLSDAQKAEWFVVTGQRGREQQAENAALRESIQRAYEEGWECGWVTRHTTINNEARVHPDVLPRGELEWDWERSDARELVEPQQPAPGGE